MTGQPSPERVSIVPPDRGTVRVRRQDQREFVDAPEPAIAYAPDRRPWWRRVSPYVRLR